MAVTPPGRQRLKGLSEAEALDIVLACIRAELDGSGALRDLLAEGYGHLGVDVVVKDGQVAGVDKSYRTGKRYAAVREFAGESGASSGR